MEMTKIKRGQASVEFVMTYGWAILAAIIAIGFLAYFGVFNPDRLTGNVVSMGTPFIAEGFNIQSNGVNDVINIEIIQNVGKSINLVNSADGLSDAMVMSLSGNYNGICNAGSVTSGTNVLDDSTADPDSYGDTAWESGEKITF